MTDHRIMYICAECVVNYPEDCGHYDRNNLRLMPDGRWLCEVCFDDTDQTDRGNTDEEIYKGWCDLPPPPEYGPAPALQPADSAQPVAWRILCTTGGATGYLYTEALPFDPGYGVRVRREPEPLYAAPQRTSEG